jgi:hypothetical protein
LLRNINYLHRKLQQLSGLTVRNSLGYPAPMRIVATFIALLVLGVAHADPASSDDPMAAFIAERGLIARIGEVGGEIGTKASELVVSAMGFLGVPYKRGGSSFDTGFDCSGFVRTIIEQSTGMLLPRRAEQQAVATRKIERSDLQPGDLVFFNTMRRTFSHVGIYVGEGKFIHSPKPGAEVRVEDMRVAYWAHRFDGARRVPLEETSPLIR